MTTAIIDYGSGNLHSAAKAFERASRDIGLDEPVCVTADAEIIRGAARIVLPGVGAFADCRHGLERAPGVLQALERAVLEDAIPFLGICVGMQLLADTGLENGRHHGLGWLAGEVAPISPGDTALKVPHMGWNDLKLTAAGEGHPVLAGLGGGRHAYFVHSYAFECRAPDQVLAEVDYGAPVTAAVGRDNIVGVQFHPEKSQAVGLRLIANFLGWRP